MNKRVTIENKLTRGLRLMILAAAVTTLCQAASASLVTPQTIVLQDQVTDETGTPLQGNSVSSTAFGIPHVNGDLVQVLLTTDGIIYPPHADGTPDARNKLLSTTHIGNGTQPFLGQPARFSTALRNKPDAGSVIFVRVFNAADLSSASFYGNSQLFPISSWNSTIFEARIASTDKALDSSDADLDGLSNSEEISLGTDAYTADSDGDGVEDAQELAAGTDAMDADDLFQIADIVRIENGEMTLQWDTVAGKSYRVEAFDCVASLHTDTCRVEGRVRAEGSRAQLRIASTTVQNYGFFRVVTE